MKKLRHVIVIILALAGSASAAPDKNEIMTAERNIWQMIKEKKIDDFQKMLTPDFRSVYKNETNDAARETAEVRTIDFKSFKLGKMDVVFIDKDVALVTYRCSYKATQKGKDISGQQNNATIWKKDGNIWRVAFHTDTMGG